MTGEKELPVLTAEEEQILTLLLKKRGANPSQRVGLDLFHAELASRISFSAEMVVLAKIAGVVKTFLTPRAMTDLFYPGEYHFPGVMVAPGEPVPYAVVRCMKDELHFPDRLTYHYDEHRPFEWVPGDLTRGAIRGHAISFLNSVELTVDDAQTLEKDTGGEFYVFDKPPKPLMQHHRIMLEWLRENHPIFGR